MHTFKPVSQTSPVLDYTISDIFADVWVSGAITRRERQELNWALQNGALSMESYLAIDRIVHAVKRGWLTLA